MSMLYAVQWNVVWRLFRRRAGAMPPELKDEFPDRPWPEIAAVGYLLRHSYERVDDLIRWKIATRSFPELRRIIASMIKRNP